MAAQHGTAGRPQRPHPPLLRTENIVVSPPAAAATVTRPSPLTPRPRPPTLSQLPTRQPRHWLLLQVLCLWLWCMLERLLLHLLRLLKVLLLLLLLLAMLDAHMHTVRVLRGVHLVAEGAGEGATHLRVHVTHMHLQRILG